MEEQKVIAERQLSWVGRMFDWIDFNILSKSARLWMYILEILGIIAISIIIYQFNKGMHLIESAKTPFDIEKAKIFIDAIKNSAGPIATMVATICGAIPSIMGIFRSLKTKWNGNDSVNKNTKEGQYAV